MIDIIEDLKWRYSTKVFDPKKIIDKENEDKLIESFILTPSSFGLQPWKLFIIKDKRIREKLVEHSGGQRQVVDSSHLLILAKPTDFGIVDIENFLDKVIKIRKQKSEDLNPYKKSMVGFLSNTDSVKKNQWIENQIFIALGNLLTVSSVLKIDTCAIGGFDSQKYDEVLGLKEKGYSSVVLLAAGYRSKDDKYQDLKKVRFDKIDIVEEIKD